MTTPPHLYFSEVLLMALLFPCFKSPILLCRDKNSNYLMNTMNNTQGEIIAMLEIMNYMYNNIEILNKCNLSTNINSGDKSDDNKQIITELIFMCK